jgi:hypothetical protein
MSTAIYLVDVNAVLTVTPIRLTHLVPSYPPPDVMYEMGGMCEMEREQVLRRPEYKTIPFVPAFQPVLINILRV